MTPVATFAVAPVGRAFSARPATPARATSVSLAIVRCEVILESGARGVAAR